MLGRGVGLLQLVFRHKGRHHAMHGAAPKVDRGRWLEQTREAEKHKFDTDA